MENKTLYVGIDIAKEKFDVSFMLDNKNCISYQTFENKKDGFRQLLKDTKKFQKQYTTNNVHICMEATGIYHCGLCEYLLEYSDLVVSVVNPFQTKSFSKSLLIRTKNDKVDSLMLAQYTIEHNPKPVSKLPENLKKLRTLVRYENSLVKSLNQEAGKLEGNNDEYITKLINKNIRYFETQRKEVIAKIQKLIKEDDFLNTQINLLITVDGIGEKSAWVILSELKFDSIENLSPKAQVSNAGLSPKKYESANISTKRTHISKMGNKLIRKVLYMPALSCIKRENYFTPFYNRLRKNGKTHRQAQVAVMRKMLYVACGVLKNQTPFDKDWALKTQKSYLENLKIA